MFVSVFTVRMKTYINISATIWPTLSVAKATRQTRLSKGCMFSLGQSKAHRGYSPEAGLDHLEVSR